MTKLIFGIVFKIDSLFCSVIILCKYLLELLITTYQIVFAKMTREFEIKFFSDFEKINLH